MTTQTIEKTCAACTFWKGLDNHKGECRVRPPQTIAFKVDEETKIETCFPVTQDSDWCGEFKAR